VGSFLEKRAGKRPRFYLVPEKGGEGLREKKKEGNNMKRKKRGERSVAGGKGGCKGSGGRPKGERKYGTGL